MASSRARSNFEWQQGTCGPLQRCSTQLASSSALLAELMVKGHLGALSNALQSKPRKGDVIKQPGGSRCQAELSRAWACLSLLQCVTISQNLALQLLCMIIDPPHCQLYKTAQYCLPSAGFML